MRVIIFITHGYIVAAKNFISRGAAAQKALTLLYYSELISVYEYGGGDKKMTIADAEMSRTAERVVRKFEKPCRLPRLHVDLRC